MTTCASIHPQLDAYADGELSGAERLRIYQHLQRCAPCASRAVAIRALGDALRASAASRDVPGSAIRAVDGLASTVTSRVRAEQAQSWRAMFREAREDWHWVLIGGGSLVATLVVTAVVSAVLTFGPKPQRDDSLAAIVASPAPVPAGYLFADMKQPGPGDAVMFQIENGSPPASPDIMALTANGPTNEEIVGVLFDAANRPRSVCTAGMTAECRRALHELSNQVTQTMLPRGTLNPVLLEVEVQQLRWFESTVVRGGPAGAGA